MNQPDMVHILSQLPRECFGVVSGHAVRIRRGYPSPLLIPMDPELVDYQNLQMGISRAQRILMERGVVFGWHTLGPRDIPQGPVYSYQVCIPLVALVKVTARSDEAAVEAAVNSLNLPDEVEQDGSPSIISKEEL